MKTKGKVGNRTVESAHEETRLPDGPAAAAMLKKILVPVDFSDSSWKAVRYAVSLSKKFHAEIRLLHVVEPLPPPPEIFVTDHGMFGVQLHEEAAKRLSQWQRQAGLRSEHGILRTGNAHREIIRAADENNTDLIILGTHGRTGLAHLLLGSTAEHVMRQAPCPVMVVRMREHDFVKTSVDRERNQSVRMESKAKGKRHDNRTQKRRSSQAVLHRKDRILPRSGGIGRFQEVRSEHRHD